MIKALILSLCLVSSLSFAQEVSTIKEVVNWEGSKIELSSKKPIKLENIDYVELSNSLIINNEEIRERLNELGNITILNNMLINHRLERAGDGGTSGGGG
jgi:hypothetical protein